MPWFSKEQKGGGVGVANPLPLLFLSLANQLAQLNQVCMLCRITNGVNKWLVFFLPPLVVGWAYVLGYRIHAVHSVGVYYPRRDWITSNLTFKGNVILSLSWGTAAASWIDLRSREDPWCHSFLLMLKEKASSSCSSPLHAVMESCKLRIRRSIFVSSVGYEWQRLGQEKLKPFVIFSKPNDFSAHRSALEKLAEKKSYYSYQWLKKCMSLFLSIVRLYKKRGLLKP